MWTSSLCLLTSFHQIPSLLSTCHPLQCEKWAVAGCMVNVPGRTKCCNHPPPTDATSFFPWTVCWLESLPDFGWWDMNQNLQINPGWWFQPLWKYYVRQNGFIFPKNRGENSKQKCLKFHHREPYASKHPGMTGGMTDTNQGSLWQIWRLPRNSVIYRPGLYMQATAATSHGFGCPRN